MAGITHILEAIRRGDLQAAGDIFPLVYEELRKLAGQKLAREAPGQTLQPTELVHEAWVRLARGQQGAWQNRAHFFAAAGEAMRRILVERARRRHRLKRGGQWERVAVEEADLASPLPDEELLALDEALGRLAELDGRAAQVVKLCFFVGLTHEQAVTELGVSLSTIERTWTFARAWLFREIEASQSAVPQNPGPSVKGSGDQRRMEDLGAV